MISGSGFMSCSLNDDIQIDYECKKSYGSVNKETLNTLRPAAAGSQTSHPPCCNKGWIWSDSEPDIRGSL